MPLKLFTLCAGLQRAAKRSCCIHSAQEERALTSRWALLAFLPAACKAVAMPLKLFTLYAGLQRAAKRRCCIHSALEERALTSRCAVTKVLEHVMQLHNIMLPGPGSMHAVTVVRHAHKRTSAPLGTGPPIQRYDLSFFSSLARGMGWGGAAGQTGSPAIRRPVFSLKFYKRKRDGGRKL